MVVEGKRHALVVAVLGELGELSAVGAHLVVVESWAARKRHVPLVLHRAGRLAIDDDAGAVLAKKLELRRGAVLLGGEVVLEHPARIPAGDELQIVRRKHRLQLARILREFAAGLGAGEAGLAAFGEAHVERRIAAELREIVVRPGDRSDAETGFHDLLNNQSRAVVRASRLPPKKMPSAS